MSICSASFVDGADNEGFADSFVIGDLTSNKSSTLSSSQDHLGIDATNAEKHSNSVPEPSNPYQQVPSAPHIASDTQLAARSSLETDLMGIDLSPSASMIELQNQRSTRIWESAASYKPNYFISTAGLTSQPPIPPRPVSMQPFSKTNPFSAVYSPVPAGAVSTADRSYHSSTPVSNGFSPANQSSIQKKTPPKIPPKPLSPQNSLNHDPLANIKW